MKTSKTTLFALTTAAALLLGSSVASAQKPFQRRIVETSWAERALMKIHRTDAALNKRLNVGVVEGSLTVGESRTIRRMMKRVDTKLRRYMRNGLRPDEARRIGLMQNDVSKTIRRLRRNRVARFGYRYAPVVRPNPLHPPVKKVFVSKVKTKKTYKPGKKTYSKKSHSKKGYSKKGYSKKTYKKAGGKTIVRTVTKKRTTKKVKGAKPMVPAHVTL